MRILFVDYDIYQLNRNHEYEIIKINNFKQCRFKSYLELVYKQKITLNTYGIKSDFLISKKRNCLY